jgi:plastocyanin
MPRPATSLAALVALSIVAACPAGALASTTVVTIEGFSFTPRDVVIAVGDTVKWVLVDGFHTTTNGLDNSDPAAGTLWDEMIGSGSFSYAFTAIGHYPYFCRFHEALDMKGSVKVTRRAISVIATSAEDREDTTWGRIKDNFR